MGDPILDLVIIELYLASKNHFSEQYMNKNKQVLSFMTTHFIYL